jgi:hypothetical protein
MPKNIYLLLALLSFLCLPQDAFTAGDDLQATLTDFEGDVSYQRAHDKEWFSVETGMPLESGDMIRTGADGSAEILIDDGSLLSLEGNAKIELSGLYVDSTSKKIKTKIYLAIGRLFSNITSMMHKESRFDIQTPTAIVGIRGTDFVVELADAEETDVGVFAGSVYVNSVDDSGNIIKEDEVIVTDGMQTTVRKRKKPLLPFAMKDRMLRHRKKIEFLRQRAFEKRQNIQRIIEKRKKVREIVLQKQKDIKQDKIERIKNLKGIELKKPVPQAAKLNKLQEKKRIP